MGEPQFPQIRVTPTDYVWLKARAEAHHRTIIGELSAVRDRIEYYEHIQEAETVRIPAFEFTSHGDEIGSAGKARA